MSERTGPGHPPVATRFRKGRSGNPKGRPKGTRAKTPGSAFDVIIDKTLSVTRNGVPRQVTVEEALQQKTLQEAFAGDRAAGRQMLKWIETRDRAMAEGRNTASAAKGVRVDGTDPRNADEALLILGIAGRPPADRRDWSNELQIETWAAQAALGRRRGGSRLTDGEIDEIRSHTRDPETLQWPRGTNA